MKTVNEVSRMTGCSIRTLHHYDAIGLLKPTQITDAGYRLYDEETIEKLFLILLFKEIGFPLKEIQSILTAPDFDRNQVLEHQIDLLQQKVTYLQNRIQLARGIQLVGIKHMNLKEFDMKKIDDYAAQAKTLYGKTDAYKEFEKKSAGRSKDQENALGNQVMDFFVRLGGMKHMDPGCAEVQTWVKELQAFFTAHYYTCTPQILASLAESYAGGGSMTENIDKVGGAGTGAFAKEVIDIYLGKL